MVLSTPLLLAAGLALVLPAMTVAWLVQRRTRNAGVVDLVWAGSLGALAFLHASGAGGWLPRRVLVAVLAGTWSVRLSAHLAARLRSETEDGRYANLRARLGERFDRVMLLFFLAQGFLAVALSTVFLVVARADVVGWRPQDAAALALFAVSLGGEALADRQLAAWRRDPANRGRTCRAGLWRYSRHPNYFFEWLHWLVYPVLAIGLPFGWATWAAPALMLWLVLAVTGIPPTEAQALRSRGDDYRAYQRTTNAFFPGPPRLAREGAA